MEKPFDVLIISAFERGAWLAKDLAGQGLRVGFVDVTDQLGIHRRSDWEGPFGIHLAGPNENNESEWEFLNIHSVQSVETGFTVWLPDGPVEFRGPACQYRLHQLGVDPKVLQFLESGAEDLSPENRPLLHQDRKSIWPLLLATQFSQTVFDPFAADGRDGAVPLQDPFWLRKIEIDEIEKSFDWLKAAGVQTFPQARILDISREGKRVNGIEISHEKSGILQGEQLVWTLSSQETERVLPKSYGKLFDGPAIQPEWMWSHYGCEMELNRLTEALPDQWIAIDDLGLPWTHDNFIIGIRGRAPKMWDIWVRRPTNQRFQRSYIEDLGKACVTRLQARLLKTAVKIQLYPLEVEMDENVLGPTRYPLYSRADLARLKTPNLSHFYFLSHEQIGSHRPALALRASKACAREAITTWQKEILRREKKGVRDDRTLPTA